MHEMPYPAHWIFALGAAFGELEKLVWRFDEISRKVDKKGQPFAGVPAPQELVHIIDGFLSEKQNLFKGDVTQLHEMRKHLEEQVIPIFHLGQESAQHKWDASLDKQADLAELDTQDFREEAKRNAPMTDSPSLKGWFVEGFSRKWQDKVLEYHRDTLRNEDTQP